MATARLPAGGVMAFISVTKRWRGTLQRGLLIATIIFSLVYALVLASAGLRFRRGDSFAIPLTPGRSLVMDIWPVAVLADRFSPYTWSYSYSDVPTNARWLGVWYQNDVARTRWRLASVTVPTWPLTAATASLWLALGAVVALPYLKR